MIGKAALESAKATGLFAGTKLAYEGFKRAKDIYNSRKVPRKLLTQYKKKEEKKRIQTSSSTEVKINKNHIVLNKKQPKGKTAGKWRFVQLAQTITRSVSGIQGVNKVFEVASLASGLSTGTDPNTTGSTSISLINLADMNPYRKITGSALHTAGATPALDKFMIKTIDVELEILNAENTACVFDLYFVTRRETGSIAFDVAWAQALANDSPAGSSVTAYPPPGAVVPTLGVKSGGYAKTDFAGESPFASKSMRQTWRLLKKRSVNMAVGVNEIIRTRILYNKVIDMASLTLIDAADHIANTSIECWCVQRGVIGFDGTVGPSPKVTYGHSTLGFVQRVQYNMCAVYSNAARIDVTYVGSNIPANTARNLMLHVDEDTEAVTVGIAAV